MARLIMVIFAILVVVGAVLGGIGVLHVRNSKDETGVTLDKKELKEKTQEAVKTTEEAGSKVLDKTGEVLHNAAQQMRKSSADPNTPTTAPRLNDKNTRQPEGGKDLPENSKQNLDP